MTRALELARYLEARLFVRTDLQPYLKVSSVVSVELDPEVVYDLMVLVPDHLFENDFGNKLGECFIVNDQEHSPPVFTRFKSYQWLRKDFSRRLPIALWIFSRAVVVQDPYNSFRKILLKHTALFERDLREIVHRKYIEFRSDRHNLRQAVYRHDRIAIDLIKANVVKLALEIILLTNGQPYPYRKWLPSEATRLQEGPNLVGLCADFLKEADHEKVISLSDALVA